VQHRGAVLFLQLTPALSLLTLDTLTLSLGQHLLVLDSQLSVLDIESIHSLDNSPGILCRLEVGKRKTAEDTVIEVVVEGIRLGQLHVKHQRCKLLLSDSERDILDNNSSRDELFGIRCR
jgi:hypothetical protein